MNTTIRSFQPPGIELTREQVREIDRRAIEMLGIPGMVLMENAGANAAEVIYGYIQQDLQGDPEQTVCHVLCGGGNNGGDGYVIARHLHNSMVPVQIDAFKSPDTLPPDAALNYKICKNMGLEINHLLEEDQISPAVKRWSSAGVLVDALLGTGFGGKDRQIRGHLGPVIDQINSLNGPAVVAVDVPSGLDCNYGLPADYTIKADLTVTFVAMKKGYLAPQARQYTGRVVVAGIGLPPALIINAAGG